ncbi:hypothetical protein PAXRUDRAFT_825907 [Paxillus rubicundulus Ve08.2h10]|uniref:Uncharacterized protein n=1 Tax=Paxillus rubicundulus Ve08.2h10 TaxID=930991 RepID=A0A0D0E594_9AGAM|nr:hypothetical protein PAXRUDRAFT_825907 [Paxillus rubicundulus Ve08.2h10]
MVHSEFYYNILTSMHVQMQTVTIATCNIPCTVLLAWTHLPSTAISAPCVAGDLAAGPPIVFEVRHFEHSQMGVSCESHSLQDKLDDG